jgi:MFS family permease
LNAGAAPAASADRVAGIGVVLAACVSAFVVNANTSPVTILLPTMSENTGTPIARLQWAVTGYLLVGAAVIVTSGALEDVLGRRKVFLAGLALFVASCVFIALSKGGDGIIIGRLRPASAVRQSSVRPPRNRSRSRAPSGAGSRSASWPRSWSWSGSSG